jgi:predicted dehydrogenase
VTLGVAVIGAGLVGSRRATTAATLSRLEIVADVDEARAMTLAARYGARYTARWQDAIDDPNVDVVVACTSNKFLAPVAIAALNAGKHVLCEKPMGRNATEAAQIASAALRADRVLKVGFTLRFHPALRKAHQLCADGVLGPLHFVQATYGHGGRPGYEKEWRGDSELAGGGELLDQGVHLLDLSRWFLGDLNVVAAVTPRWHWDVGPLEDNAFVLLQAPGGQVASLHTSWTMWKNRFCFEVYGRDGYARVDGLGGSYGVESLTLGRKRSEGSVPDETVTKFDQPDQSWEADWSDLISSIETGHHPEVDGDAGLAVMRLVAETYETAAKTRAEAAVMASTP